MEGLMGLESYFSAPFFVLIQPRTSARLFGGVLYIASTSMKTVIPLRIAGIASALCFPCSGIFARSFPPIFLYSLLLPLNTFRLYHMLELIKKVRAAASSDLTMDWLLPFMHRRSFRKATFYFAKATLPTGCFWRKKESSSYRS
jgi:CRP/FNR family cyclic AMP-dependent transcriptional regulator